MPTPANALDITAAGYVKFDGTNSFSGVSTVPIADGGTNATSFTQSNGIVTYDGTRLVNYAGPQLSSGGVYTNSTQPCFSVYLNTSVANVTGDGTLYTVLFDTKSFDQSTSYNTGTGVFTAPITGRYLFTYSVCVYQLAAGNVSGSAQLVTSGMTYSPNVFAPVYLANANGVGSCTASVIVPMTANDTARIKITASNTGKVVGVLGVDGGGITYTTFTGCLLN